MPSDATRMACDVKQKLDSSGTPKTMTKADSYRHAFNTEALAELFPADRADRFFEALLGDPEEGAYNIHLAFKDAGDDRLDFEFHLTPRPGKCLRCSLTYGLPDVFSRHPIINVQGLVDAIDRCLDGERHCTAWTLGRVREIHPNLHSIPLTVRIEP